MSQNSIRKFVADCILKIEPLEQKLVHFLANKDQIQIKAQEFMKAYDSVQVLNTKGVGSDKEQIFDWSVNQIKNYINSQIFESLKEKEGEQFLDQLINEWDNFKIYIYWMYMVLIVFAQGYKRTNHKSVQGSAFMALRDLIFLKYKAKINGIIFNYLNEERGGNVVPQEKIAKVIKYIVELGYGNSVVMNINKVGKFSIEYTSDVNTELKNAGYDYSYYQKHFEVELIEHAQKYYCQKSQDLSQLNSYDYVIEALKSIKHEYQISQQYFLWSQASYIEVLDKNLVIKNSQHVATQENGGIKDILKQDKIQSLEDMYTLFKRKPDDTYSVFASELKSYITQTGVSYNEDEKLQKEAINYIQKIIEFKNKMDDIMMKRLGNIVQFQDAKDQAFKFFLNNFEKSTRYLAMNTDNELKQKMKGLSEEEVDTKIKEIKSILSYLNQKDAYIEDYSKYLSKRLLNQTIISDDWEQKMISSLKSEVGQQGVFKLTSMCQDIQTSKEKIQSEFKEHLQENKQNMQLPPMDINVTVLTKSFWPIKSDPEKKEKIPEIFHPYTKMFQEYYEQNFGRGRQLDFLVSQGYSEMYGYFGNKPKKILVVTNQQMAILLVFNNLPGGQTTYKNILEYTGISGSDIREHLLALVKTKILLREKKDLMENFEANERVFYNENFEHKQTKIKCLPGKDLRKKPDQKKQTEENVKFQKELQQQRENVIDAKIVMIMKAKRVYTLNEIIQDCISLVKLFQPSAKDIKKRVESLIEKDYLERDAENPTKFIYKP